MAQHVDPADHGVPVLGGPLPVRRPSENPMAAEAVLAAVYRYSRGGDAVVAIGSRRSDGSGKAPYPHYLSVLSVANPQPLLPGLLEYGRLRGETLYWVPNPLRRSAVRGSWTPEAMTEHVLAGGRPRYVAVKNEHVLELAAIVVDLDVGREGSTLTAADAIGIAVARSLDGRLVAPSIFAYTGRGALLMYLLREASGYLPLASRENVAAYKGIQAALLRATDDLDSDPMASRLANWYKLPQTVDTKTGREVVYLPYLRSGDRDLQRYDLGTLAEHLGVEPPELRVRAEHVGVSDKTVAQARISAPGNNLAPRTGADGKQYPAPAPQTARIRRVKAGKGAELYRARFRELEMLMVHRGGLRVGIRHAFLRQLWLAVFRDAYVNASRDLAPEARRSAAWSATWEVITRINLDHCKPPLPLPELRKLAGPCRYTAARVIAELGITATERETLGLRHLVTDQERAARRGADRAAVAARRLEREDRQAAIDADLRAGLGIKACARKHGVDPSTTSRRLAALRRQHLDLAPRLPMD